MGERGMGDRWRACAWDISGEMGPKESDLRAESLAERRPLATPLWHWINGALRAPLLRCSKKQEWRRSEPEWRL